MLEAVETGSFIDIIDTLTKAIAISNHGECEVAVKKISQWPIDEELKDEALTLAVIKGLREKENQRART